MERCLLSSVSTMLPQISDDEVVGRVRSGDTESYGVLATRYHAPLCRVARRMLRSDADVEDAVQGAHLLALTHLDQYSGGSNYFRWMYSIVVNEARTQMRKGRRSAKIGESYTGTLTCQPRSPEQQAVDRDVEEILDRAVERVLSARFRLGEFDPPDMIPYRSIKKRQA